MHPPHIDLLLLKGFLPGIEKAPLAPFPAGMGRFGSLAYLFTAKQTGCLRFFVFFLIFCCLIFYHNYVNICNVLSCSKVQ